MLEKLRNLFKGKESKKEEVAEKKMPSKIYAKGEKMEAKAAPARKTTPKVMAKTAATKLTRRGQ
jgi:hypothetical protein